MPSNCDLFKKNLNPIFIETGSYLGDGIKEAIKSGFEKIISIELSKKHFDLCSEMFKDNEKVKIIFGDSSKVLKEIIDPIEEKITFWLDGHYSCGDTAMGDEISPLLKELEAIKTHKIKNHTIIIDDLRCWNVENEKIGFGIEEIKNKILEINSNYLFFYEDGINSHNGEIFPNDILIASIPN